MLLFLDILYIFAAGFPTALARYSTIKKGRPMYTEKNNGGIYVERRVRVPGFSMQYQHLHNYYEIFYLKTGSCIYTVNSHIYHLTAGDVFFVIPGDSHSTSYEGLVPCERTTIYCRQEAIPDSFWDAHPDISNRLRRSGKVILVKRGQQKLEALLDAMLEENNIPDEFSNELMQLQTMTLLLLLQRNGKYVYEQITQDNGISHDIEDALRYIAQNYAMPLSLEEVAEQVKLTPTYLSRKFKKVTGTTFKEYVNYIRIRQASQMLLTTDDSVTKIAVSCGFNSSNYFKDCFRRINGVSPRAFRKQSETHSFEMDTQGTNTLSPVEGLRTKER